MLLEKVEHTSIDDVNQQLKDILLEPGLKVFPSKEKIVYTKNSNIASIEGYDYQCQKSRKEYHKAKNK